MGPLIVLGSWTLRRGTKPKVVTVTGLSLAFPRVGRPLATQSRGQTSSSERGLTLRPGHFESQDPNPQVAKSLAQQHCSLHHSRGWGKGQGRLAGADPRRSTLSLER